MATTQKTTPKNETPKSKIRRGISSHGRLGLRLAKEVARIRGGLEPGHINLALLDEVTQALVQGQFQAR
jgi:hypothetical protein